MLGAWYSVVALCNDFSVGNIGTMPRYCERAKQSSKVDCDHTHDKNSSGDRLQSMEYGDGLSGGSCIMSATE